MPSRGAWLSRLRLARSGAFCRPGRLPERTSSRPCATYNVNGGQCPPYNLESDLQKLRIDNAHRAGRDERAVWPWVLLILLIVGAGIGLWQWRSASAAPTVQTIRVKVPEGAAGETDLVMLNATGYVMAAHKIELASKVVGRVAWVGVEMGDKIEKGQELVRLEDDEFRARVAQQQGLLDNAKAYLAELHAGSRPQEIAAALARVDQAQAELANAEANYQRLKGLDATKDVW